LRRSIDVGLHRKAAIQRSRQGAPVLQIHPPGDYMNKLLSILIAAVFAFSTGSVLAASHMKAPAGDKKEEVKKDEMKKETKAEMKEEKKDEKKAKAAAAKEAKAAKAAAKKEAKAAKATAKKEKAEMKKEEKK
jgi:mannitol-specific phosphotransferase system IIBC component